MSFFFGGTEPQPSAFNFGAVPQPAQQPRQPRSQPKSRRCRPSRPRPAQSNNVRAPEPARPTGQLPPPPAPRLAQGSHGFGASAQSTFRSRAESKPLPSDMAPAGVSSGITVQRGTFTLPRLRPIDSHLTRPKRKEKGADGTSGREGSRSPTRASSASSAQMQTSTSKFGKGTSLGAASKQQHKSGAAETPRLVETPKRQANAPAAKSSSSVSRGDTSSRGSDQTAKLQNSSAADASRKDDAKEQTRSLTNSIPGESAAPVDSQHKVHAPDEKVGKVPSDVSDAKSAQQGAAHVAQGLAATTKSADAATPASNVAEERSEGERHAADTVDDAIDEYSDDAYEESVASDAVPKADAEQEVEEEYENSELSSKAMVS